MAFSFVVKFIFLDLHFLVTAALGILKVYTCSGICSKIFLLIGLNFVQ